MRIAVIGAGISGLVSGFMLAKAGHDVTIFEREVIGSGSSGKAVGLLVPISGGMKRKVDDFQREGVAAWPELAEALAKFSGENIHSFFRDWGDGSRQVRVPHLYRVMAEAFHRLGGHLKEHCGTVAVRDLPGYDRVIMAAGWENRAVGLNMKIVAGQALRVKPKAAFRDLYAVNRLFIVPDWDDTVLIGSGNWDEKEPGNGTVKPEVTEELLAKAIEAVPALEGCALVEAWVGYRPMTEPRLPLVRKIGAEDGRVLAIAGLGKVGLALAPVVGKEVLANL